MNELGYQQKCEIAQTLFVENFEGEQTKDELMQKLQDEFGYSERKAENLIKTLFEQTILIVSAGKTDVYKLQGYLSKQAIAHMV